MLRILRLKNLFQQTVRKGHLDRVQVGGVLRQEQHPCASGAHGGFGFGTFVDGQAVEDDDISGPKRWGELGLDVDVEGVAIHRAGDHPWRAEAAVTQPG